MSERQPARSATLRVKLRYATVDQFLLKYGPNISRGGIFIATKAPKPVGTTIHFEFVLLNGDVEASVLSGEGIVHFVREPEASARAPGMGLKFTKLHDEGQALVDRVLRMRNASAEAATTTDMPEGVREVTGEFELRTGPHAAIPPEVPPMVDASPVDDLATTAYPQVPPRDGSPDIDALLLELGVSAARVDEVLHRDRVDASDEALEGLRHAPREQASTADAVAQLDALLRRR